ncbi:MAG TPA: hypothetical protein VH593_06780 [Ktedonobacteraceae bacterium]|jgi:hypothetical protein
MSNVEAGFYTVGAGLVAFALMTGLLTSFWLDALVMLALACVLFLAGLASPEFV